MFDITKRRVSETGKIELKGPDGTPLKDDDGNVLSVTVHGPGSKVWQEASADLNRQRAARLRKAGGRIEGAMDSAVEDQVELLARVTISFNGWEYPDVGSGADMFRAAYGDPLLGFIRDQVLAEVNDWAAFTGGSAKS
jgi:hypothetical protein